MDTIATIEQQFVDELADLYCVDEAKQICFMAFENRLEWTRQEYLLRKHQPLDEPVIAELQEIVAALRTATPIQYVLGYAWFRGMKIRVNESVLIPRPETEELVGQIISEHQKSQNKPPRIIDIGTGSGCIAIALKKAIPNADCYALDISPEALRVARQNAAEHTVKLTFINADILEWDAIFESSLQFDIIVSNPPYITDSEQHDMHQNVLGHEPHIALFVADTAPLLFYEYIASFAQAHLTDGGHLYFEINRRYGQQISELLRKKGFANVELYPDIHGADRIIRAEKIEKQS